MAEVEGGLLEDETVWSPYLRIEDTHKLDDVRESVRKGDLKAAARFGRVYEIHTLAEE